MNFRKNRFGKTLLVLLVIVALIVGVSVFAQDQAPLTGTITYTVQAGDVPDLIAAQYDVDLVCLMTSSNLTIDSMIFPGDTLQISADCPRYQGESPVQATRDLHDAAGTYTVRRGDTLDDIGKALDVSVVALQVANDLPDGFTLHPNDVLTIPPDAPAYGIFPALIVLGSGVGGSYVVQPGDTLDAIGRALDVSVVALQIANGLLNDDSIHPGDVLTIPTDAPAYGVFPPLTNLGSGNGEAYVVQPGDTLEAIAQKLDVSLVSLEIANGLQDDNSIAPGDVLTIPADAPAFGFYPPLTVGGTGAGETYVVQPGDVLDLIAAFFNKDVQCLIERNSITFPLYPGFVLLLPPNCPTYSGFSTPRPEQIRGLGLRVVPATPESTQPATRAPATTSLPPTATLPVLTATSIPPTATIPAPTATSLPPTVTAVPPTPTHTVTPEPPVQPPAVTQAVAG